MKKSLVHITFVAGILPAFLLLFGTTTAAGILAPGVGVGTLTVGTVFTLINNTKAGAITGTFSNLADGSTFTNNGNNYQVSYAGGTGNDLTLTVVP